MLFDKGIQNQVPGLALVDRKEILEIEPYCTVSISVFKLANYLILPDQEILSNFSYLGLVKIHLNVHSTVIIVDDFIG